VLDGLVRGRHRRTTITHDRATDLRGVGLLKISDGYLGPVLYARTRADPKSRLNSYTAFVQETSRTGNLQ
jgi:hypothetical protein